jgi:hypothetical protein
MPGSPALYFKDLAYGSQAATMGDVLGIMMKDLPSHGFSNVKSGQNWIAVRTPSSHGCVAFVGSWPAHSFAVIMAAGDDAEATRDKLVARLDSYVFV